MYTGWMCFFFLFSVVVEQLFFLSYTKNDVNKKGNKTQEKNKRKGKKKEKKGKEKENGGGGGGVLSVLQAVAGFALWAWINPLPIYPISFPGLFPFNSYLFCRTPQYLTPSSALKINSALYPLFYFPSTRAIKGLHRGYNTSCNSSKRYAKMSATKSTSQVMRRRSFPVHDRS